MRSLDRKNQYDGEEEYWVTIRETGKKTESLSYEEVHQKEEEASHLSTICFGLNEIQKE